MLQSIELFSGTGLVSQILKSYNFKTLTIDFNKSCNADICEDILTIPINSFPLPCNLVWASPDCRLFSRASDQKNWCKKTLSYRNYSYIPNSQAALNSINLLSRTVDLIKFLKPQVFFIENPIGRIHHMPALRSLPHYRYAVNYADWGFSYSKETYIFTNQLLPLPTSLSKSKRPGLRSLNDKTKRSFIPPALIHFLITHSSFYKDIKML
jgi:site-specific DNA-cytosine methylase